MSARSEVGFWIALGAAIGVFSIVAMAYAFGAGETHIAHMCDTLGKFDDDGKVYECKQDAP